MFTFKLQDLLSVLYLLVACSYNLPLPPPPSLIRLTVSVDVKHHDYEDLGAQELCESRGGRPGLPVRNSPNVAYSLCGRNATLNDSRSSEDNS